MQSSNECNYMLIMIRTGHRSNNYWLQQCEMTCKKSYIDKKRPQQHESKMRDESKIKTASDFHFIEWQGMTLRK